MTLSLTFHNIPTTIKFIHRKSACKLSIRVDSVRRVVTVTSPNRRDASRLSAILEPHRDWVETHLMHHQPFILEDGMLLPLLGQDVRLQLTNQRTQKRIILVADTLTCASPVPHISLPKFLKSHLLSYISEKVETFSELIGVSYTSIQLKNTRSRWGSCAQDGKLSFQWKLVFAPRSILDYVIAHEVSHLKHFDHSPAFWAQVEVLDPDFQAHRQWLKEKGKTLLAYFAEARSPETWLPAPETWLPEGR